MSNKVSKNIIIGAVASFVIIVAIAVTLIVLNKDKKQENEIGLNENTLNMQYNVDGNNKKPVEKPKSALVETNKYNTFSIKAVTEESLVNKFLEDYKYNALNHPEDAYNSLDEEYRNAKFDNLEDYKKYLSERQEVTKNIELNMYQIINYDGYDEYICLDQEKHNYIFKKLPNMKYTVILDTYTVDLPEFLEKYNKATDENKVAMNAEKIKEAINAKDYEYVYNKLDETFKQSNFSSLETFAEYVKNSFFESNTFNYTKATKEEGVYVLRFNAKDVVNGEIKAINGTIVMQLKEDTDFVMSFSLD